MFFFIFLDNKREKVKLWRIWKRGIKICLNSLEIILSFFLLFFWEFKLFWIVIYLVFMSYKIFLVKLFFFIINLINKFEYFCVKNGIIDVLRFYLVIFLVKGYVV